MPLTDIQCRNATAGEKPIKLFDGKGLYLHVKAGGKYWRFDYRFGKRRTAAYGVYPEVSLKEARESHFAFREQLRKGLDPQQAKVEQRVLEQAKAQDTFEAIAMDWYDSHAKAPVQRPGRRPSQAKWSASTAQKMLAHLTTHIFPSLGRRPVASISVRDVAAMLAKIQDGGAAYTATRLREVCSQIFLYAQRNERCSSNPADALRKTVIAPPVTHRPALTNTRDFGQFLRDLASFKDADALTLLATRLALLTMLRSAELRGGMWAEIDLEAKEWRIPASRMKMGKNSLQDHIVPLSEEAICVIENIREFSGGGLYMFPSIYGRKEAVMSENTIGRMLIRMGYKNRQTLHGFRASARSILSERGWSFDALERQLDHIERNSAAAPYARSDHLAERRQLMAEWAEIVLMLEQRGNIVHLNRKAA